MDIEVRNLNKCFGEKCVLDNLSQTFPEGKSSVIMGASGCGKTTLLSILMGLCRADSGEISGLEDKKMSAVFQEDRLCENLSAYRNVRMVCDKNKTKTDVEKALADVGLSEALKKPVRELSGGMKRRCAIARAVAADSDLIFLDEPFKGLDEKTKNSVMQYVKDNTKGKTVIMVTHDKTEADFFGGKAIQM